MSEEMIASLLQGIAQKQNDHAIEFAKVATTVGDMHKRLFGNGQPGALAVLNKKIEDAEDHSSANTNRINEEIARVDRTANSEINRVDKKIIRFGAIAVGGGAVLLYGIKLVLAAFGVHI